MVTRADPPYPITPIKTSSFHIQDARGQLLPTPSDTETPSSAAEGPADGFRGPAPPAPPSLTQPGLKATQADSFLPVSLQAGAGTASASARSSLERPKSNEHIPEILRPGPPSHNITPQSSQEGEQPAAKSTNPFHRAQQRGQQSSLQIGESSTAAWAAPNPPAPPSAPPPPPPGLKDTVPCDLLGSLSLEPSDSDPRGPVPATAPFHINSSNNLSEEPAFQASRSPPPNRQPPPPPLVSSHSADRRSSVSSQDSDDWNNERTGPAYQPTPPQEHSVSPVHEEHKILEESQGEPKSLHADLTKDEEGVASEPESAQNLGQNDGTSNDKQKGIAPTLPPRREAEDEAPLLQTLPVQAGSSSEATRANNELQKKETYEIKKISWHDDKSPFNPRVSPILVQNNNGPCPLLALVNALNLSTPVGEETALVETLRSREQVSLGLLLDAVIEELFSGRPNDDMQVLPDFGELYDFLITLHTGMNVNPLFFPPSAEVSTNSKSPANDGEPSLPGTFEATREMKLYGTFSIPLIHGWLPLSGSQAYLALSRSAKSYEDAQNIMFREEELEDKLSHESLSLEEQTVLEDISTIKAFLSSNGTQLTKNGLETIRTSMKPGSVAILFRNDHFSTLYRHPGTLQLFHLVTDMGYAGHDEVVWESLADVKGENCEFFSGDFRIVSENAGYQSAEEGWTVAKSGSKSKGQSTNAASSSKYQNYAPPSGPPPGRGETVEQQYAPPPGPPPGRSQEVQSPTSEQEDHDLALALQLQDEEEQKQREDIARRKREADSTRRYIEQQSNGASNVPAPTSARGGGGPSIHGARNRVPSCGSSMTPSISASSTIPSSQQSRPNIPPRRGAPSATGSNVNVSSRPMTNRPVDPEAGEDVPPPSYEQAATQAAYVPPVNHPAHPTANPAIAAAAATNHSGNGPASTGRRRGNLSPAIGNVVYGGRSGRASNMNLADNAANSGNQHGGRDKESCALM